MWSGWGNVGVFQRQLLDSDKILLERHVPLDLLTAVSTGPRAGSHVHDLRRSWWARPVGGARTELSPS